jgi:ribosome-associated protein
LINREEDGQFDLDQAIKVLKSENVQDLVCIEIPKEINYADFMVIGTCFSDKHLNSAFLTINRKYKLLKDEGGIFLQRKIGKESKWSAIDTGKIVIHLFLPEYREYYDLETLWTCGSEFDEKYIEFLEHKKQLEQKITILEVDEVDESNKKYQK